MKTLKILFALVLFAAPVAAQDPALVSCPVTQTATGGARYVVVLDGVEQAPSFNTKHKASERATIEETLNAGSEVAVKTIEEVRFECPIDWYENLISELGAPDSVVAVDTVPTPSTAGTGEFDPYLPAAWTDTVHYEDFTGMAANARFDTGNGFPGAPRPFTEFGSWNGVCTGARISGYSVECVAQDSVVFAGQASPPWVWEGYNPAGGAGQLIYKLNFDQGNGPAAKSDLTRVYVRYSMFFEEAGNGIGRTDYRWSPDSNKFFQFNEVSNGFLNAWYEQAPEFRGQSSPATEPCPVGLTANTWEDYYPGDVVSPQGSCTRMGRGGFGKRGVWQHHFVCMDFSRPPGQRVISYGMSSEDEAGIAAYHNNVSTYNMVGRGSANDFDSWMWNGTYGGTKNGPAQSYWFDDLLVMTGSAGSCVTPPSFS